MSLMAKPQHGHPNPGGDCISSALIRLEKTSTHDTTGHFTVHSFVPEKATYTKCEKGIPYLGSPRTYSALYLIALHGQ